MQQICSRSWRLRAIRKLSGPEVGLGKAKCRRMSTQPRVPRSPFMDNFPSDDSPSDQPMGYIATASVDPSQRQSPLAFSSSVEICRAMEVINNRNRAICSTRKPIFCPC